MPQNNETTPNGKLFAIGGAIYSGVDTESKHDEDVNVRFQQLGILRRFLNELEGKTNRIEIITTASRIPVETGQHYIDAFTRLGNENIDVMHINEREDVFKPEFLERIQNAEGVLLTGGNQLRLTTILGGSELLNIMLSKYQNEKFVLAGTSAGAMAMSNTMIYGGSSTEALLKGEIKIARGLDFIKDVTFDSHFIKRGRFGRLCQSIASNPASIGIGLGEDTGLLITDGNLMEAVGSGLVIIVEGNEIRYTNVADIHDGEPISIDNLTVHVLAEKHSYILSERKIVH